MASSSLDDAAVASASRLIDARQDVLDSDSGDGQPDAAAENRDLESHSWDEYEGASAWRPTTCSSTSTGCRV